MARRYSASQIRSKVRQAQQKQRHAIDKYNQAVRKYNRDVQNAVNKYNQAARTHNARVRANRQRLKNELARFQRQSITTMTTRYIVYRTSVLTLHDSYVRLENYAASRQLGPEYNRILELSELETANSLAVANRIFGDVFGEETDDAIENAELLDDLRKVDPDLDDRWKGAIYALNPRNPDATRHFCTSAREIITKILEIKAPDGDVFALLPNCAVTERGKPTRRSKIRFLLHRQGVTEDPLEDFIENDLENIVELFHILNAGTHGSAGTFDFFQLGAIKKRVEDVIKFLMEIIGVD